jgi:nitrogen regulatory protein P-II 1
MKLISGVVRPDKVDDIKAALEQVQVLGMTVTEVRDHWPQKHGTTVWRGHEYDLGFSIKMAIEVVVHDDEVDEVIGVIIRIARTGRMGDGHVSVLPVEHRYNIRDGARDVS